MDSGDNYRTVAVALTGTTAVQLLAQNINRKALVIDNTNAAALLVSFDGTNFISIPAGTRLQMTDHAPSNAVTMKYGSANTTSVVALEG